MKIQAKSILKTFTLFLFWMIFPPLFLTFSIIWKMPKLVGRIVLTVFAPLTIVSLIVGVFGLYQLHYYYIERGSRSEIEAKTGLKFPDYEAVEKRHFTYKPRFHGDFTMERTIKLDTVNIADFYKQIDRKIEMTKKDTLDFATIYWNIGENGHFRFTHFDFRDDDDQTIELEIDKRQSLVRIIYGSM